MRISPVAGLLLPLHRRCVFTVLLLVEAKDEVEKVHSVSVDQSLKLLDHWIF